METYPYSQPTPGVTKRNGMETERNGTERNGTERNGTERNGTERNGTERNAVRNGTPCGTERRVERNAVRAAQVSKISIGIANQNRGAIFFGVAPVTPPLHSIGGAERNTVRNGPLCRT